MIDIKKILNYISDNDIGLVRIIKEYYNLKKEIEDLKQKNKNLSKSISYYSGKRKKDNALFHSNLDRIAEIEETLRRIEKSKEAKVALERLKESKLNYATKFANDLKNAIDSDISVVLKEYEERIGFIDDIIGEQQAIASSASDEEISQYEYLKEEQRRLKEQNEKIEQRRKEGYSKDGKEESIKEERERNLETIKQKEARLEEVLNELKQRNPETASNLEESENISYFDNDELLEEKLRYIDYLKAQLNPIAIEKMMNTNPFVMQIYNEINEKFANITNSTMADMCIYRLDTLLGLQDILLDSIVKGEDTKKEEESTPQHIEIEPQPVVEELIIPQISHENKELLDKKLKEISDLKSKLDSTVMEKIIQNDIVASNIYNEINERFANITDYKMADMCIARLNTLLGLQNEFIANSNVQNVHQEPNTKEDEEKNQKINEIIRLQNIISDVPKYNVINQLNSILGLPYFEDLYNSLKDVWISYFDTTENNLDESIRILNQIIQLVDTIEARKTLYSQGIFTDSKSKE